MGQVMAFPIRRRAERAAERLENPARLDNSREAAERNMAQLQAERLDPQIPFRDLLPYRAGNTGIPYAFSFDSGRPGAHVAVTCLAHGNEPGGMVACATLLERGIRPLAGRLTLIFCNIAAYHASNGVDPYGARFVDEDFNRIWDDAVLDGDRRSTELERARQIRPLVASADILLDLHATPYEATPFFVLRSVPRAIALAELIGQPRTQVLFPSGATADTTLTNYGRFGRQDARAVGMAVECGLFFARRSAEVALATVLRLLCLKGLVERDTVEELGPWNDPEPSRQIIIGPLQPTRNANIKLLFRPGDFRSFAEGEIVAWDDDEPIAAPFDNAVPMWVKQRFEPGVQAFMFGRLQH